MVGLDTSMGSCILELDGFFGGMRSNFLRI